MRRFFGGVLILCILISLLTIGVSAGDDMLLIAPAPSAGGGQRDGYTDVPQDHWAAEAIDRYTGLGALQGNPDGSFEPDAYMTCAQLASFISRAFKLADAELTVLDDYPDADKSEWYAQTLANCISAGIIGCDADTTVAPDACVTREQAVVMLCRVYEIEPLNNVTPNYIDAFDISPWAAPYIAALTRAGILKGYPDKTFKARDYLSRAESVHLAARISDEGVAAATYTMKAVVKGVGANNSNVTMPKQVTHLTGISGITAELCYLATTGQELISSVFAGAGLDSMAQQAVSAFNAGGEQWREFAAEMAALTSGDSELIDACIKNSRVSALESGREYKVTFGGFELTVTVTAN
ncbi:MAG: S-layer homology domain-containing protein [Clostridia bacterium]|nr:S-layer homology domain-containing protein [Clostridia bacterium]